MTDTKLYQSLIVPNLNVDIANYLCEIVLTRKFKYKPDRLPKVEFWRSQYKNDFKELQNLYIAELTQIKKLLKVFSSEVILKFFKENDYYTIRFLTKDQSKELIFGLFIKQYEFIQSLKDIKKTEIELVPDKVQYIEQARTKKSNLISKGL